MIGKSPPDISSGFGDRWTRGSGPCQGVIIIIVGTAIVIVLPEVGAWLV